MMRRRTLIAGAGLAAATSLSGCLQLLDEGLTFEAVRVSVPGSALERTGYREEDVSELVLEPTFEVAGRTRTVVVRNWQAIYTKGVDVPGVGEYQAATFAALSSPKVEVLGRAFNPVGEMSARELANELESRFDEIESLRLQSESTVRVLGERTRLTSFVGETRDAGSLPLDVEMALHVTEAVESGDDFVVAMGAHPHMLSGERSNVMTLMESISHG